jgi:hypothetical protein
MTSFRRKTHFRSSGRVLIIGNITRTSPNALARRIARNCLRKSGVSRRQRRTDRTPRDGFFSGSWGP